MMPNKSRRLTSLSLTVVLSTAALAACGGAPTDESASAETVGKKSSAVQGGTVDNNTGDTFAVGVANRYGGVCSGTLIAPNLVLTARHCVVPPTADESVTCADKFANNVDPKMMLVTTEANLLRASSFYRVTTVTTPTDKAFCGNDLALLTLAENIPETEAKPAIPVVQFQMTDTSKIGGKITAIGYGITSPKAEDSGIRRIREDIDILCVPGSETNACTGKYAQLSDSDAEFVTEGWVCSGDSGSGAFEQTSYEAGTPYVLGTLSRGPQTEETCLAAIYSRTDAHADLIISTALDAAEAGGYDAPSWAKPASTDTPTTDTPCEGDGCDDTGASDPASSTPTVVKTTTTSGCSAAPSRAAGNGVTALIGLVATAVVLGRRGRRARRDETV